jgi:pimeloyl-ACP methyl ester carboxylesterase
MTVRIYGQAAFRVALLHGGPGAGGEMAPVARRLSSARGILEPLQTATSVDGQVDQLKAQLERHADLPVTLVGYSWGAFLGFLLAARQPEFVRKLILVGSGPFDGRYADTILSTRLRRLSAAERDEATSLLERLEAMPDDGASADFARVGALLSRADAFDPLPPGLDPPAEPRPDIYRGVWPEARRLRASGDLLELGRCITCPVVAIHGDYDSHPAAGVEAPLRAVLPDFKFHLLEHCGHTPWLERQAAERFYALLEPEL